MTPSSVPAAALVQAFFVEYLLNQKHASPRTLAAYRDAFRLLLGFVRDAHGVEPAALNIENLDAPIIFAFLDHIERQRANSIRSRNARLAAIRSFFRFVQMREPAAVAVASRVLAIPVKRSERKLIGYLTRPEIDALLSASGCAGLGEIARQRPQGTRRSPMGEDSAGTAGLVSRTRRPIWRPGVPQRARRLSRHGVCFLLSRLTERAAAACPSSHDNRISPPHDPPLCTLPD